MLLECVNCCGCFVCDVTVFGFSFLFCIVIMKCVLYVLGGETWSWWRVLYLLYFVFCFTLFWFVFCTVCRIFFRGVTTTLLPPLSTKYELRGWRKQEKDGRQGKVTGRLVSRACLCYSYRKLLRMLRMWFWLCFGLLFFLFRLTFFCETCLDCLC